MRRIGNSGIRKGRARAPRETKRRAPGSYSLWAKFWKFLILLSMCPGSSIILHSGRGKCSLFQLSAGWGLSGSAGSPKQEKWAGYAVVAGLKLISAWCLSAEWKPAGTDIDQRQKVKLRSLRDLYLGYILEISTQSPFDLWQMDASHNSLKLAWCFEGWWKENSLAISAGALSVISADFSAEILNIENEVNKDL